MISGRINRLYATNFRLLKKLHLPLDYLAVYLGENGTGKTNIYRALELCHHAALGDISKWLAKQGGMDSTMWAGEIRAHEKPTITVSIELGDYCYTITLGFRSNTMAAFDNEPLIKEELLEFIFNDRKQMVMHRTGPSVKISDTNKKIKNLDFQLLLTETALSTIPAEMASNELASFRNTLLDWRFYHSFRVDEGAPIRQQCNAITATKLDADGANLAAVFATLEWIREDAADLKSIVSQGFNGAKLVLPYPSDKAEFSMVWPDMPKRPFKQSELSDGTIQFLATRRYDAIACKTNFKSKRGLTNYCGNALRKTDFRIRAAMRLPHKKSVQR